MISVTICSPNLELAEAWDDLVRRAQPNVFMNPAALKAAHDTGFADVSMLLAWDDSATPRRLAGLWSLQRRRISALWPTLLEALPFDYAFLSSPVLDPELADAVMPAFLDAIAGDKTLPNVLSLHALDADAPSYAALQRALVAGNHAQLVLATTARPVVSRAFGVKRSGSTRKKLRQDFNRLSAQGTVAVVNDRGAAAVAEAFETFLTLEAGSWKGARGTALLCNPVDAGFTRRLLQQLALQGHASVAELRCDGRPIAAQVLMYCGTTAYTWKTAFDAEFAKFSPGALLVDKVTEELFAQPGIEAIDSCSVDTGFMGQLWSGRRTMVDLLIDVGPTRSFGFTQEAARLTGYERLRALRDRLRETWWRPPKKVAAAA
jgi:hypothetical protein